MLNLKPKGILFAFLFLSSPVLLAQNYTVNLLVDEVSKEYLPEIKKQSKALFESNDKLHFKTKTCQENCEQQLLASPKKVALLQQEARFKKYKKAYLITHNMPTVESDVNRLTRTVAMAVYELYKERSGTKTVAVKGTDTQGMGF